MTKAEILTALQEMTSVDRLEIIDASRIMREEIEETARRKAEKKKRLRASADVAAHLYEPRGPLHDLWS